MRFFVTAGRPQGAQVSINFETIAWTRRVTTIAHDRHRPTYCVRQSEPSVARDSRVDR
jgi:hypothetical protein